MRYLDRLCFIIIFCLLITGGQAAYAVKSIAHRGASLLAPENTCAAFSASSNVADLVEFDVRVSSDGELVVMHDTTVDRTTDGTGLVNTLTLAQLKTLDAGSWFSSSFAGEEIPTLAEALDCILPFATPLIERKAGSAGDYVAALQTMGVTSNVVVQSFNWSFLGDVNALDPSIRLAALGNGVLTSNDLANLQIIGVGTVAWAKDDIAASDIDLVDAFGMELFAWTANGSAIQDMIDLGVDGIISDDPALVRELALGGGDTVGVNGATTIGFVGAAVGNNGDIPFNYGGNIAADGPGWTTSGGATPDVTLIWEGGADMWEYHTSGFFDPIEDKTAGGTWDANPTNAVAQLQGDGSGHQAIHFSVPQEVALVLLSFDIGNATDQVEAPYGFDLTLVRDSDSFAVWSHTTSFFAAGDVESVVINYTGEAGEGYTLNFDRNPTNGITYRTGIDNLRFGQIVKGNGTTTIGFVGAAGVNANLPFNYGSNVEAAGTGWTTSAAGGTPNIALEWSDDNDPGDWEFHNSATFTPLESLTVGGAWDAGPANAVAQMQAGPAFIKFSVDAGVALVLHSFDIGNATDAGAGYGLDLSLVRDSDSAVVWSYVTPIYAAGEQESQTINYTGGLGESYTLNLNRTGGGTTWNTGIDNLSFSQIPPIGEIAIAQGVDGLDLTWSTGVGGSYVLLETTNVVDASWSTNQSGIAGGATNVTVTVLATNNAAFFKVSVE